MPENKGYIWNNCIYFGEGECNDFSKTTIFKHYRNGMEIHEWIKRDDGTTQIIVYDKKGYNRQKIISNEIHINPFKKNQFNLFDYIK